MLLNKSVDLYQILFQRRHLSGLTANITKIHRLTYFQKYPTVVVLPSGATFQIRHPEPRAIIKLPLDMSTLNDDEKRERMEKKRPKLKMKILEVDKPQFDPSKYIKLTKKK